MNKALSLKLWKYGLPILAGVLLIALIVVSAFAYQWHGENADLKKSNQTLKALNDTSTLDSIMAENSSLHEEIMKLTSENEQLALKIEKYEQILTDNNLMPEE